MSELDIKHLFENILDLIDVLWAYYSAVNKYLTHTENEEVLFKLDKVSSFLKTVKEGE